MKIERLQLAQIQDLLLSGKVIVLYGPRQVGKTTLARTLQQNVNRRTRFINRYSGQSSCSVPPPEGYTKRVWQQKEQNNDNNRHNHHQRKSLHS